jgi:hypothetical protein
VSRWLDGGDALFEVGLPEEVGLGAGGEGGGFAFQVHEVDVATAEIDEA